MCPVAVPVVAVPAAEQSLLSRRESLERKLSKDLGAAAAAAAGSAVLCAPQISRSVSTGDVEKQTKSEVRDRREILILHTRR